MCPDNDSTSDTGSEITQNPTLAEDDKFRRKIEVAEGPNVNGYDDQIKRAHTLTPDGEPVSAADIAREDAESDRQSTEKPEVDAAVKSDVEPSTPAPAAVPMPSPSAVREE